jgi:hypothetical protein
MHTFEQADFEFTLQELYAMTDQQRKWAELPCRVSEDGFVFYVGSQSSALREHEVLHDDTQPIHCDCEWAKYHKHICKPHFWRAQQVLKKRNARIAAQEKEQQERKAQEARRVNCQLTKQPGFHFLRQQD